MRLRDVLAHKSPAVVSITPGERVSDAIGLMAAHRVGSVLVQDRHDHFLGLLSERDIVLGLVEQPDVLRTPVWLRMQRHAPAATPDDSIVEALKLMHRRRTRHLPVLDAGSLVGVVSLGDLLQARLKEAFEAFGAAPHEPEMRELVAGKPGGVFALAPDVDVRRAVVLMHEARAGAIVVQDGARRLRGVLSERDVALGLAAHGDRLLRHRLRDVASADGPVAGLATRADAVMAEMSCRRVRHVPVIEAGRVAGVVSLGDIAKARLDALDPSRVAWAA